MSYVDLYVKFNLEVGEVLNAIAIIKTDHKPTNAVILMNHYVLPAWY